MFVVFATRLWTAQTEFLARFCAPCFSVPLVSFLGVVLCVCFVVCSALEFGPFSFALASLDFQVFVTFVAQKPKRACHGALLQGSSLVTIYYYYYARACHKTASPFGMVLNCPHLVPV